MTKPKLRLRIIGDVHGHTSDYVKLAREAEYSIQLGDMGFNYQDLYKLDPLYHRVVGGNHDNYTKEDGKYILQPRHFFGDFGVYSIPDIDDMFFVRGGYSIDWKGRTPGRDWWSDEELTHSRMQEAIEFYRQIKPAFVLSHECPSSQIEPMFGLKEWDGEILKPSNTALMLEEMWKIHKPKKWIFGHFHIPKIRTTHGTTFQCLEELGIYDFIR